MDYTQPWTGRPLSQQNATASGERSLLRCELCRKTFASEATADTHRESAKHKRRVHEAERLSLSPIKKSPSSSSPSSASRQSASPADKQLLLREQGSLSRFCPSDHTQRPPKAAERTAVSGASARAAQELYDVGMEHARSARANEAERCLTRCLALLPRLTAAASVARVMIEVKARSVLARLWWGAQQQHQATALSHVRLAVRDVSVVVFGGWVCGAGAQCG
jgi:hypothetical protein